MSNEDLSAAARSDMVDRLVRENHLSSTSLWRDPLATIPREVFVKDGVFLLDHEDRSGIRHWKRFLPNEENWEEWVRIIYSDASLVTQLNGYLTPLQSEDIVAGSHSSSTTTLRIMSRMLEELLIEDPDDIRLLEIGGGTGYTTAVMSQLIGDQNIVSIEYDGQVSIDARNALRTVSCNPIHINGDGLIGYRPGAPYNRILSTCGVEFVPVEWMEQSIPGGHILTTTSGCVKGSGLARLIVQENGTASGSYLHGEVSFVQPRTVISLDSEKTSAQSHVIESRDIRYDHESILDNWMTRFVVQLGLGTNMTHSRTYNKKAGTLSTKYIDRANGSMAVILGDKVRQTGDRAIWDEVEHTLDSWNNAGRPPIEQFRIESNREWQRVWVDGEPRLDWTFHRR